MYYYQGSSEIQADCLQTLYLMNPNYLPYSDTQNQYPQPNTAPPFFNPTTTTLYAPMSPHAPPSQQFIPYSDHLDHDFPAGQIISPNNFSTSPNFTTTSDHWTNGVNNNMERVIMGSKYLKAARELLDEVVSVGKGRRDDKAKIITESMIRTNVYESSGGGENGSKKAKLNSMLDEVEQRYKQYHHQMQIIVTSFEQVIGTGSAKSYTHLALKTILKQFMCLKKTISAQIRALSKIPGEEENSRGKMEGSRLKFVDHHLRQQRTLQHLGMMQNNAWRPQRGLPERAVSVLRAWLFEHFLHPYPKDSDKHMLSKQTGLTKSQVSNWFINARVRLWKPMVEDMYLEEIKNQEISQLQ